MLDDNLRAVLPVNQQFQSSSKESDSRKSRKALKSEIC